MVGLIALAAASLTVAAAPACAHDRAALLALPADAFDETIGQGWRIIGDKQGCEAAAADLIGAYRAANAATLVEGRPERIRSLNWHEGQLRAAAGQIPAAITLLVRGTREPDDSGDSAYQQATVAYLRKDWPTLLKLRDRIAAMPKPDWFERTAEAARTRGVPVPPWPMHLGTVEGLIACFDKPYSEAYSMACRPPATASPR